MAGSVPLGRFVKFFPAAAADHFLSPRGRFPTLCMYLCVRGRRGLLLKTDGAVSGYLSYEESLWSSPTVQVVHRGTGGKCTGAILNTLTQQFCRCLRFGHLSAGGGVRLQSFRYSVPQ